MQMQPLLRDSIELLQLLKISYIRPLYKQIHWEWRLIGLKGARGVGKTTLLIQRLKETDPQQKHSVYLSLDDLYFTKHSLKETVRGMRDNGIVNFYLDEVHKYPTWSRELKNIYDLMPDIKVVFSGSSILQLLQQDVDLSRRVVMYNLCGLSFREYLLLKENIKIEPISLNEIITNHTQIALDLNKKKKLLPLFHDYLKNGYYPFFLESGIVYYDQLKQVVNLVLETDLRTAEGGNIRDIRKLALLLQVISESVPFKPNISKLASNLGINRATLTNYIEYLNQAQLIAAIPAGGKTSNSMRKPEKIYLDNTDLIHALSIEHPSIGNIRETFFQNQLRIDQKISIPKKGDFLINEELTFEVGGPSKTTEQIKGIDNAFLAVDGIGTGYGKQIPLWLFGLMY